jgi:ergothioneine biosynthesis protein EgtB
MERSSPARSTEPRDAAHAGGLADSLLARYREVRATTEAICRPLAVEDHVVQTMTEMSPTKWHLAHTSWFFETFILENADPSHAPFHPAYRVLFNSYYTAVGARHARPDRGLLSRPTVAEVYAYRKHVDRRIEELLARDGGLPPELAPVLVLGLNHEQQHQELILTDLKHLLGSNPLRPAYREPRDPGTRGDGRAPRESDPGWTRFPGGLCEIGHAGGAFAFDNEGPRHRSFLEPFTLAGRLATNGEYLSFMADGGYLRPELWLSDGYAAVTSREWRAPLYWEERDGAWWAYTLEGLKPVDPNEPVCHISYYEADAFARWSGARLADEREWETASRDLAIEGNLLEAGRLHPSTAPVAPEGALVQMFGDLWEWTRSPYGPYPGYTPPPGALGEYNGKFMCNQMVLRGGSCATPRLHLRRTYRNFFPPESRWQFTGIRLARDA